MKPFNDAWQLLKRRYSEKDILDFKEKLRREAESGYASNRGSTGIEHLMGMKGLGQQYFPFDPTTSGMHDLNSRDSNIERRKFERGYKDRMNPKPVSRPTKVRLMGIDKLRAELVDDDNNIFSSLGGTARGDPQNFEMTDLAGDTEQKHKRQGHYGNLMNTLLQHGIGIHSDNRNNMSQPFHEKFQQNLAPNINLNRMPPPNFQHHNPEINERKQEGKHDDFQYSKNRDIESPEGWGSLQPDYGQYPLVNEAQLRERREPYQPTRQSKLNEDFTPLPENYVPPKDIIMPPEFQELQELFG
tara:strand:+ start:553 stop:1452 length:900 start_codon:yes stop_codon:yes gene_type:complete